MLQAKHYAIFSTFIKLPIVFESFVLSIFEWPLYTGYTVFRIGCQLILKCNGKVHLDLQYTIHVQPIHIRLKKDNASHDHEISNNVVCATSKASDQPAHTRSLIRAFAIRLNIP